MEFNKFGTDQEFDAFMTWALTKGGDVFSDAADEYVYDGNEDALRSVALHYAEKTGLDEEVAFNLAKEAAEGLHDFVGGFQFHGPTNESRYVKKNAMKLTESKLRRIVHEAVESVLCEGMKGVDPENVVSEDDAIDNGFKSEYGGFDDGLELWGKDIEDSSEAKRLKRILGIDHFTSISETRRGYHVRITVRPNEKSDDDWWLPQTVGDYVNIGYGDKDGVIFHNPKNGHSKHLRF